MAANLAHWFLPWTVTRAVWRKAMKSHVSGVSIDVFLFSDSGSSLLHHYRVFGRNAAQRTFVESLWLDFGTSSNTQRPESRWGFNCLPSRQKHLLATSDSDTLRSIRPRDPKDESPLCKTARRYPRSHRSCTMDGHL